MAFQPVGPGSDIAQGSERQVPARWRHARFTVQEKVLTLGRQLRVLTGDGTMVGFARQKMFKLREDIRVYADESQQEEVLLLRATKVLEFNANFEVVDPTTQEHLGFIRRKGWSSFLRDKWAFTDVQGNAYAVLQEDSLALALVRRFVLSFLPTKYHVRPAGDDTARSVEIKERFQLYGDTYDVLIHQDLLDPRVAVAMAVLLDVLGEAKE